MGKEQTIASIKVLTMSMVGWHYHLYKDRKLSMDFDIELSSLFNKYFKPNEKDKPREDEV